MNRTLHHVALVTGLAVVGWVGIGYVGTNPLALVMTALIAAFYVMGALELQRYHQATSALVRAVAEVPDPLPSLRPWLEQVPPSLQNAVRLRVEGERAGLPGPAMTPYLAGLLVLLGMLGTFLGMVLTLHGTGLALESASDLQAVRASLVGPVKGLGLAFGTSVAGVAASAALGLMSALCRRERLQAGQQLDARIATTLRVFSVAHQREESLKLLQRQAEVMPVLVDRLQAMMERMERQAEASNERLTARQESFHGRAEAAYAGLAASVDRSLKESLAESTRIAGATIQPVVEATLAGIARETRALNDTLAASVEQQAERLSTRFESTTTRVADTWAGALAQHERASLRLSEDLRATLDGFADTFDRRSASLVEDVGRGQAAWQAGMAGTMAGLARETASLQERISEAVATRIDGVAARLDDTARRVTDTWRETLANHERASDALSGETGRALAAASSSFEQHAGALLRTVAQAHAELQADSASRQERLAEVVAARIDGVATRLDDTAQRVTDTWRETLAGHERASGALAGETQRALAAASSTFEQHAASLLQTVARAHADLQSDAASRDQQRLAAWTQALESMAASLQDEWRQAGARTLDQQQRICETMERTARDMTSHAEAHASNTIAEIARLVQAAAEAPRAAAEVISALREQLSDAMARDNTVLEERGRIMETLGTLLEAVNQAATEQRGAIDALVGSSATLLDRVGARFAEQVDAEAGKLEAVAAQVTGSAVEVASLGEAFGAAVRLFSDSNEQLTAHLQRIEGALAKSLARSDEQLAYYVAQAREVVDLSILSQKQIIEDLQQLAGSTAGAGRGATAGVPA